MIAPTLLTLLAAGGALAIPTGPEPDPTSSVVLSKREQGTVDGFFYSHWNDESSGTVEFTNGYAGYYKVVWDNIGNFVTGKGWKPGNADRVISYDSTWNNEEENSYLAIYGWTTDPLIEYYIVEAFGTGSYNPSANYEKLSTVTTDGGTYDIFTTERVDKPSIQGTATFTQFWSVRQGNRVGGNVTVKNHFDAWAEQGMELGTHDYQIVATEGYKSSGSSEVTVYPDQS